MKNVMILGLVLLVGCGGAGGGGSKSHSEKDLGSLGPDLPIPAQTQVQTVSEQASLQVEVKRVVELLPEMQNLKAFGENVNNFDLVFTALSGHFKDSKIKCVKTNSAKNDQAMGSFDKYGQQGHFELSLKNVDPVEVKVECEILSNGLKVDSLELKLTKSIFINQPESMSSAGLTGSAPLDLIVIGQSGVLSTQGLPATITANEIISQNGIIATVSADKVITMDKDTDAPSNKDINIVAGKISGTLSFELRGHNGGEVTKVPEDMLSFPPTTPDYNGREGNKKLCNGKTGPQGYKGRPGFNGTRGGDTGALYLRVENVSDSKISINYFPGKGSAGGVGSKGGPGGNGGQAAGYSFTQLEGFRTIIMRKECSPGAMGPRGVDGDRGQPGNSGEIKESSIIFGSNPSMQIYKNWSSQGEN